MTPIDRCCATIREMRVLVPLLLLSGCATTPVRVMVYNIHAGKDSVGIANLDRVADVVRSERADIVLLQEVDRKTTRSGDVDQVAELVRLTGLHGAFGKSLDYQGGEYGIAILSRWPISGETIIPLRIDPPQVRAGGSVEPRVALVVDIAVPRRRLRVLNTHLDASRDDRYRLQETEQLVTTIAQRHIALAGGDLNAEPDSRAHERMRAAGLRDAWLECGAGPPLTFPALLPVKRIDYLFLSGAATCNAATVLRSHASDHRAVLFVVKP